MIMRVALHSASVGIMLSCEKYRKISKKHLPEAKVNSTYEWKNQEIFHDRPFKKWIQYVCQAGGLVDVFIVG